MKSARHWRTLSYLISCRCPPWRHGLSCTHGSPPTQTWFQWCSTGWWLSNWQYVLSRNAKSCGQRVVTIFRGISRCQRMSNTPDPPWALLQSYPCRTPCTRPVCRWTVMPDECCLRSYYWVEAASEESLMPSWWFRMAEGWLWRWPRWSCRKFHFDLSLLIFILIANLVLLFNLLLIPINFHL